MTDGGKSGSDNSPKPETYGEGDVREQGLPNPWDGDAGSGDASSEATPQQGAGGAAPAAPYAPPAPPGYAPPAPPGYSPPAAPAAPPAPSAPKGDIYDELDGGGAPGAAFQDEIPTAYESGGGNFEIGQPDIKESSPSFEDQVSTVNHELSGDEAAEVEAGQGFSEVGLDDPPTSPSQLVMDDEEGRQTAGDGLPQGYQELEVDDADVVSEVDAPPTAGYTPSVPLFGDGVEGGQTGAELADFSGGGSDQLTDATSFEPRPPMGAIQDVAQMTAEGGRQTQDIVAPQMDMTPFSEESYESLDDDFLESIEEIDGPDTMRPAFIQSSTAQMQVPPSTPDQTPESSASDYFGEAQPAEGEYAVPDVVAPSFEAPISLLQDDDVVMEKDGSFATQLRSNKLLTSVTSITKLKDIEGAEEPPAEHRDVDPRPFLESLQRNPLDSASMSALRRIYAATGDWDSFVEQVLGLADSFTTSKERFPLLNEVARVFEKEKREPDKAQVVIMSAFLFDPTNDEVAERLSEITSRAGLWAGLFAELGQAVAQEAQIARRTALCARLGDWYLAAGHVAYAQPCYQQALQADPTNLRAMSGMAVIFEQSGDVENLDAALAHIPPALPPGAPAELGLRVAGLYERRGNDSAAATSLEQALSDHPDNEEMIEAFERILGKQERWAELAERLARRARKLQDAGAETEAVVELWRRVAILRADQVADHRGAEEACRVVLDLVGGDLEIYDLLERIYQSDSRWAELVWVLEQKLERVTSSRDQVALLMKLAQIEAEQFVKLDEATARLERLLELEPRNAQAHEQIVALHRRQQKWPELADALERFALAERTDEARFTRLVEAAQVRSGEMEQHPEAVQLIKRALKIMPQETKTLGYYAETLLLANDANGAFEAYKEQASSTEDVMVRAGALVKAADIARDRLLRNQEAMDLLEQAVSLDPTLSDAASSLRQQRMAEGDWHGAARALEAEIARASGAGERGRLLIQLAELRRDGLRREMDAIDAYEGARAELGDVREVLLPLFELYMSQEHVEEAAELSRWLGPTVPKADAESAAIELVRYARVTLQIGDKQTALGHLEAAIAVQPEDIEALPPLADLYEELQRWEDARRVLATYTKVLERERMAVSVDLQARLGRLSRLSGRNEDARRWFEAVLVESPKHNEALRHLAAICEGRGELHRALELLSKVEVEDELKLNHASRVADLAQRAKDDEKYEEALRGVLSAKGDDHKSLTRLLELYSRQERWSEAVEVIIQLAGTVEDNAKARAKYFSAAAKIYRDKLGDLHKAAELCDRALDEDWTNLIEFESLDRMLTKAREYKLQERVYRKMIRRVTGKDNPALEAQLWHALGEIYRSRLQRFEEAAEAFKVAAKIEPGNLQRHMILAELFSALNRPSEAIEQHKVLLKLQPGRVESLKAMREICSATQQYDRAFALISHLAAIGQADQAEVDFFQQWLPKPYVKASVPLGDEEWLRYLRHPDEDPYVSSIFETILSVVLAARSRPQKELGLSANTAVDLSQGGGSSVLAQQFLALSQTLGLRMPPALHVLRDQPTVLAYAVTNPIASIMGGTITQLPEPERVFLIARHLAYYQGGRFMANLAPSRAELTAILVSATAAVTGREDGVPATAKSFLNHLKSSLQRNPPLYERLGHVVQRFLARGGQANLDRWMRGVELSACRAGLLVVADPRVAASALKTETSSPAAVPTKDRIQEMLNFVVTDEYLALRKALGVEVG